MKVYDFKSYKDFINAWLRAQPNNGRGLLTKIASELGIHTTLLSHTIRGDKHLTLEQVIHLADFMGLSDGESEYLLTLLQIERAGTQRLKTKFKRDLERLKTASTEIIRRVPSSPVLNDEQKSRFYSSWLYSAIRQMTSLPEFQTRGHLLDAFPIERDEIHRILDFLLEAGLCVEEGKKIKIGPAKTHVDARSPYVYLHHRNWRLKAMEKHHNLTAKELMYTAPFTVSEEDFASFREQVVRLIEQLVQVAGETSGERLACFNVDLFYVR